jgi:pyroglutamyl-peptidase
MNTFFIVTGFGSFGSVKKNPTERCVRKLAVTSSLENVYKCDVLDVSSHYVDDWIESVQEQVQNDSTLGGCRLIFLHLGVCETASCFKLEEYAYNEANFRIPDTSGFQPRHQKIVLDSDLGAPKKTGLPVHHIIQNLLKLYGEHSTEIVHASDDPGRYVCNYLYYKSLMACENAIRDLKMDDGIDMYALFCHVPLSSSHVSVETFVKDLVKEIASTN